MKIKVAALGALVPMLAYVAPSFAAPTAEAGPPNLYSSAFLVSGLFCDGVTDDTAADNTIMGNSVNDIIGTPIADSGQSNVIGPNNISLCKKTL